MRQIRVDLTFEIESLPECVRPKVMEVPKKTKEYPVPHSKQKTPKKPDLALGQESTCNVMVFITHETLENNKPMDLVNDTPFRDSHICSTTI